LERRGWMGGNDSFYLLKKRLSLTKECQRGLSGDEKKKRNCEMETY